MTVEDIARGPQLYRYMELRGSDRYRAISIATPLLACCAASVAFPHKPSTPR